MTLEFDASPEELKLFMEEAEEHLQLLEEDLVRLETESDNQDLLGEIFRAAHTLKGSSATLGHQRMAQLTHGMENIFDKIRKNQLKVTSFVMDVIFEALDCLKLLKDEIETLEESDVDLDSITNKLKMISEQSQDEIEAETEIAVSTEDHSQVHMSLSWEEKEEMKKFVAAGSSLMSVMIKFSEDSEMIPVRCLITMMTLRELGQIVSSSPTEDEIEREEVSTELRVVLASEDNLNEVNSALEELPDIDSYEVKYFDLAINQASQNDANETDIATDQDLEQTSEQALQTNNLAKASSVSKSNAKAPKISRTIRVDVELFDTLLNLVGELVTDRTMLAQMVQYFETHMEPNDVTEDLNRTSAHIGRIVSMLQEEIMKARMLPVESLFSKFPRMMRDLCHKAGKEINFVMEGQETELDRSIIEEIGDPLIHLLRNAVDHAIELPEQRETSGKNRKGTIQLVAKHEENHIIIIVKDDGKGIDSDSVKASAIKKGIITEEAAKRLSEKEAINLIFASGLSTKTQVSEVSGRGVGMDVVRNNLEKVNGVIEIDTQVGKGSEFKIKLPLTLAIIRALLVSVDERVYAIPLTSVTETIRVNNDEIQQINKREAIVVRGRVLPLLRLNELYNHHTNKDNDKNATFVVVVNIGGQQMGLVVDYLVGEQEIVIKSLGKFIGDVPGISGATFMGDGRVALIVDVPSLLKKYANN